MQLCKKYDFWQEAYNLGKVKSEAWWLKIGRIGTTGKIKANGYIWRLNMQNRFGWYEKKEEIRETKTEQKVDRDFLDKIRKELND